MPKAHQALIPHLWFDSQAHEAAKFYVSAFGGGSAVTSTTPIPDTPSGNAESVGFRLLGYEFMAISAGPLFTINPSISFFVNFDPSVRTDARAALDALWGRLSEGGSVLMSLDTYPFSERYGWIQDRYGVSWQLILSNPAGEPRPAITPSLMFTRGVAGKAEEAKQFYLSVFEDSREGTVFRHGEGGADRPGTIAYEDFMLRGQWFAAMDAAGPHDFAFSEAVSIVVSCDTQEEIDRYWARLSAVPQAEQCGWCKDKYGVSWQVTPSAMRRMMAGTPEQRTRVVQAFLRMKKFDIATLERAYDGRS